MGAGASASGAAAAREALRPADASDLAGADGGAAAAVAEVVRLRGLVAGSLVALPEGWARAFDESSGYLYYFSNETGEVRWSPPAEGRPADAVADTTAFATEVTQTTPELPPPTPTAATLARAHHTFQTALASSTKTVIRQLRRQHAIWEHDWHTQLLEYVSELRAQVEVLRDEDEKRFAKLTKTAEDRATVAEEEAEEAASAIAAEREKNKEDRHAKLMAKLAARKKAAAERRAKKQSSKTELIGKLKASFSNQISGHMKQIQAASLYLDVDGDGIESDKTGVDGDGVVSDKTGIDGDGIVSDKTGGWVQLYDDDQQAVYYWHAEQGSTWERPQDMEFNLHLKRIWSQATTNDAANLVFAGKEASADALEKWFLENNVMAEELEDGALEAEIGALEDELEKRRKLRHHAKDHELVAAVDP
jgi:hypothetical protein